MEEQRKKRQENIVAGVVGAFLGTLLGVVCTVVIGQLGYVASVSGLIMAVGALKGYELLGGRLSKKGAVISSVLILVMTWLAHRLTWAIAIASELDWGIPEAHRSISFLLEQGMLESAAYWGDLAMLYLFTLQKEGSGHFGREIEPAGVLYLPARDEILSMERNVAPEKLKSEREKQLRRSGLLLAEPAVLQAMEHDALREPRYLPLRVNRNGELSGSIASAAQLGRLGQYVERQLRQIARELRQGNIDADPYWQGADKNPCRWCDYKAACHFEEGCGDRRRFRRGLRAAQFWEWMDRREEDGGGH